MKPDRTLKLPPLSKTSANPPGDIKKTDVESKTADLTEAISDLQTRLYAASRRKVLVVLQGMDTSGKNGTVKKVFARTDPNGVRVVSFQKPTENELARDFLWRIHQRVPKNGELVVFNRSHYEDVIATRVRGKMPQTRTKQRYGHINDFEKMLTEEGTTILKFFLHIDQDEQRERLQKRIDNPKKHWKIAASDFEDRKLWSAFQQAYQDAIDATHTPYAPWQVIPANAKWYRNFLVAQEIVNRLTELRLEFPKPAIDLSSIRLE